MAGKAEPLAVVIDPDDDTFIKPCDMPRMIREFCERANQSVPADDAAVVRTALDSLALKYRWVIEGIESITGHGIRRIHIVGGGTQNKLLSQLAADLTGRPVIAGPVEATAIGNVLVQAMACGQIASVAEAREIVRTSCDVQAYQPQAQPKADEAFSRLKSMIER